MVESEVSPVEMAGLKDLMAARMVKPAGAELARREESKGAAAAQAANQAQPPSNSPRRIDRNYYFPD